MKKLIRSPTVTCGGESRSRKDYGRRGGAADQAAAAAATHLRRAPSCDEREHAREHQLPRELHQLPCGGRGRRWHAGGGGERRREMRRLILQTADGRAACRRRGQGDSQYQQSTL